jgi:hypothetical protein
MGQVPATIEIMMDCPSCQGRGEWDETYTIIDPDPKVMDKHLKEHAYSNREVPGEKGKHPKKEWIGANCDCPRVERTKHRVCDRCKGHRFRIVNFVVPKAGETVLVKQEVLTGLFGAGNEPQPEARVHKVEYPYEDVTVDLTYPIGVYVSWDRLTRTGGIPKGQEVDLWTLDITEFTRP